MVQNHAGGCHSSSNENIQSYRLHAQLIIGPAVSGGFFVVFCLFGWFFRRQRSLQVSNLILRIL